MTREEAYDALARAALSARKLALYAQIERIESLDELGGEALVRETGSLFGRRLPLRIGESSVWATDEQPEAFYVYRNQTEWRTGIGEIADLLKADAALERR